MQLRLILKWLSILYLSYEKVTDSEVEGIFMENYREGDKKSDWEWAKIYNLMEVSAPRTVLKSLLEL